jgi:hypothetical protein
MMRKIKPVRYAAVVLIYLCASGFTNYPAGIVRAIPGNHATGVAKSGTTATGHPSFSPSSLYIHWNLGTSGLGQAAFEAAVKGYRHLSQKGQLPHDHLLTIIDFTKASTQQRLFVVDMRQGRVLFRSLVAHGQQSGGQYAHRFSNEVNSHQSSLGLYITANTYTGAHGYSLRLKGCQAGLNHNAWKRDIVLHGADYATPAFVKNHGYLGRSQGCPAVPPTVHEPLINLIKNGTALFMYHPQMKRTAAAQIT